MAYQQTSSYQAVDDSQPTIGYPPAGYPPPGYGYPPPAPVQAIPVQPGVVPTYDAYPPPYPQAEGMGFAPSVHAPTDKGPVGVGPVGEPFTYASGPRDLVWAIVFIVHLVAVLGLAIAGGSKLRSYPAPAMQVGFRFVEMVAMCFAIAIAFSMIWLMLMKRFPAPMIWVSFVFTLLLFLGVAIFAFVQGSVPAGVIMIIMTVLFFIMMIVWRKRVAFSAMLLSTGVEIVNKYPATTLLAFVSVLVQILYMVAWAFTFWVADDPNSQGGFYVLTLFVIFSMFWVSQVVMNTTHTTVCGTVASWYFLPAPSNPTAGALKRSLSSSFGSICLGSLLVATIKFLRFLFNMMRSQNPRNIAAVVLACVANCFLGILERLLRYFNKYAFCEIAVYGKTYCDAARDTFDLFARRGLAAMINDSLVEPVLTMGCFVSGSVCALAGGAYVRYVMATSWVAAAIAGFWVGFVVCAIVLSVVDSAVTSLFVCYAEDPAPLQRYKPELYAAFAATDARV